MTSYLSYIFPDLLSIFGLFQKSPPKVTYEQDENYQKNETPSSDLMTLIEIYDGFQTCISLYRPIFTDLKNTYSWMIFGSIFNNLFENKEFARVSKYAVSFFMIPSKYFFPLVVTDLLDCYIFRPFHSWIKAKHTHPTQNEVYHKLIGFMIPPVFLLAYGYHSVSVQMTISISPRISFFSRSN